MYPNKQSSAIDCLQDELHKVLEYQSKCLTDYGTIKNEHKYRYNMLVRQAKEIKSALDWFNALYSDKVA